MSTFTRRRVFLAGALSPLLASCANDLVALRERPVDELAQALNVCAVAYTVLRGGVPAPSVALSGCGAASGAQGGIFQAASLTKPVVAYAALQLALAGRLDLDAPVSLHLPAGYRHFHHALARGPADAHDVVPASVLSRMTVGQLLHHTAGLPNWSNGALLLQSPPGERWSYSGEGFAILQAVLEAVTQTELSAHLDAQVFRPLGMADSSLVWRDALAARAVSGTTALGSARQLRFSHAVAAASLYTTAADYARFMAALLGNPEMLARVLARPVEVDRALGLQWGAGWGVEQTPEGPFLWQWGNNPGFRAFAMASVARKDGFVLLTNSDRGMPLAASLARTVLPTAEHHAFRFSWVG